MLVILPPTQEDRIVQGPFSIDAVRYLHQIPTGLLRFPVDCVAGMLQVPIKHLPTSSDLP